MKTAIFGQKHTWKNITSEGCGGVYQFNISAFCKVCSWIISWQPCVLQGVGGAFSSYIFEIGGTCFFEESQECLLPFRHSKLLYSEVIHGI